MRLLDLFCGAGGAAMGYYQAGFDEIVGVDIEPQPDYPFDFVQGDALDPWWAHEDWDLIHASPPCQDYTPMSNRWGSDYQRLIPAVRDAILSTDTPYVIENVAGAADDMVHPVALTGSMFGLKTHRLRLFELGGWFMISPAPARRYPDGVSVYGPPDGRWLWQRKDGTKLYAWSSLEEGQEALEVPWITEWHGVREAIPPAYTRYIGTQFINQQVTA